MSKDSTEIYLTKLFIETGNKLSQREAKNKGEGDGFRIKYDPNDEQIQFVTSVFKHMLPAMKRKIKHG